MLDVNPLAFLLAGIALLVSTATVAILNRRAAQAANPYDDAVPERDLSVVLRGLRLADAHYRLGRETGMAAKGRASPEEAAAALSAAGLGKVTVRRTKRRVEWHVVAGPHAGAPGVEEPLCYFTLGLLRGATGARVVEETCHGTGAAECLFTATVV